MTTFTCTSEWIKNEEELQDYVDKNVDYNIFMTEKETVTWIITELVRTGRPDFLLCESVEYNIPSKATGIFVSHLCVKSARSVLSPSCLLPKRSWTFYGVSTNLYVTSANECIQGIIINQVKKDTPKYILLQSLLTIKDICDTISYKIIELYFHGQ